MKGNLSNRKFIRFIMLKKNQYYLSISIIALTLLVCQPLANTPNYHLVSYLLLFVVALLATFMELLPVVIASVLSALAWNFFFIPPHYTFQIGSTEDTLVFLMFFLIAMLNGILTNRIKFLADIAQKARFLAESDKLYSTLFNSISHELRIPVSTIMGVSETLLISRYEPEIQKELHQEIFTASIRLNRVIENLLNMSRLESGRIKPNLDWHDINDLLNKVSLDLEPELNKFRVTTIIDPTMPLVMIDYGLIEQVFYNLFLNVTQNAPPGTEIITEIIHSDNVMICTIKDSGPGVPENKIEYLFDKFYRINENKTGGLGLGLSIVKGFIEAHKGTITVENRQGAGALFKIRIPSIHPDMNMENLSS